MMVRNITAARTRLYHVADGWRKAFANVLAQVDEIEGKAAKIADKLDRDQAPNRLAATEVGFHAGRGLTFRAR